MHQIKLINHSLKAEDSLIFGLLNEAISTSEGQKIIKSKEVRNLKPFPWATYLNVVGKFVYHDHLKSYASGSISFW
jgi:hypothetical protein